MSIELARGRRSPYTQVGEWVTLAKVSRTAKHLYTVLSAHVNQQRHDGRVWPSRATLADLLDYDKVDSIDPFIKELVKLGAVEVVRRKKPDGSNDTNLYVVHETPPPGYAGLMSLEEYYERRTPQIEGGYPRNRGEGTPEKRGEVPPKSGGEPYEENQTNRTNKTAAAEPLRDDVELLCAHFNQSLEKRGCKTKKVGATWRRTFRLMVDTDELTPKQIMDCIDWVTGHEFWYKVVLSPDKLRAKYEQLRMQATEEMRGGKRGGHRAYQDPADLSEYLEEL